MNSLVINSKELKSFRFVLRIYSVAFFFKLNSFFLVMINSFQPVDRILYREQFFSFKFTKVLKKVFNFFFRVQNFTFLHNLFEGNVYVVKSENLFEKKILESLLTKSKIFLRFLYYKKMFYRLNFLNQYFLNDIFEKNIFKRFFIFFYLIFNLMSLFLIK